MPVTELVSPEQYLHTSFEHDAEFVEGRIVERPVPTYEHSCVQSFLIEALRAIASQQPPLKVLPEQRVQTRPDRFRVPDICVVSARPGPDGIVRQPPYLCVEILSPEDSMRETLVKMEEYLNLGVSYGWIVDPHTCLGQIHAATEIFTVRDKVFRTDTFSVNLTEVDF